MASLSYSAWLVQTSQAYEPSSGLRLGQHFYNELAKHRKDIADRVPDAIDPFYKDFNLNRFLNFAHDVWDLP